VDVGSIFFLLIGNFLGAVWNICDYIQATALLMGNEEKTKLFLFRDRNVIMFPVTFSHVGIYLGFTELGNA
jgi:hypothetical protein